jgi:hypothetical protein
MDKKDLIDRGSTVKINWKGFGLLYVKIPKARFRNLEASSRALA